MRVLILMLAQQALLALRQLSLQPRPSCQGGFSCLSFMVLCQAPASLPLVELHMNLNRIDVSTGMAELCPHFTFLWAAPRCPSYRVAEQRSPAQLLSPGAELQHGSFCFLLESIFCPAFIAYCVFLWGQQGFARQKWGFLSGRCSWLLFSCVFV